MDTTRSIPIITNKITIPRSERTHVKRPHLFSQLDSGLQKRLTIIQSPAGFGKTSLLTMWLERVSISTCWLSLDALDNDIQRFFTYLIASIKECLPNMNIYVDDPHLINNPNRTIYFLNDFIQRIADSKKELLLVIDDYHLIHNASIHESIYFILQHMPRNLHLLISTRHDPSLNLSKLRLQSHLLELNSNDLKFIDTEAVSLFESLDISISKDNVKSMVYETEGWVSGLKLFALTLNKENQYHTIPTDYIYTNKHIMEYFTKEILDKQSIQTQEFLLKTSVLRQFSRDLCQYTLNNTGVDFSETLSLLYTSNLFMIPLDDHGEWYRYHHLFRDTLEHYFSLRIPNAKNIINELHLRASHWYMKQNNFAEAFYHASSTGHVSHVLQLLESTNQGVCDIDVISLIIEWIDTLSVSTLNAYPSLYIWKSSLLLKSGKTNGVEELLNIADHYIPSEEKHIMHGRIALAKATLALTKYDISSMIKYATMAINTLDQENIRSLMSSLWILGFAHQLEGNFDKALEYYNKSYNYGKHLKDTFTLVLSLVGLGNINEQLNQRDIAENNYLEAISLAQDKPFTFLSEAHLGLSKVYLKQNHLNKAYKHGKKAVELASGYDPHVDRYIISTLHLVDVLISQNNLKETIDVLLKLLDYAQLNHLKEKLTLIAQKLHWVYVHSGNNDLAAHISQLYSLDLMYSDSRIDKLTKRELEVLNLIAKGLSNQEISDQLFLSLDTVKGHNRRIFQKLQVSNRTKAAKKAKELHLL